MGNGLMGLGSDHGEAGGSVPVGGVGTVLRPGRGGRIAPRRVLRSTRGGDLFPAWDSRRRTRPQRLGRFGSCASRTQSDRGRVGPDGPFGRGRIPGWGSLSESSVDWPDHGWREPPGPRLRAVVRDWMRAARDRTDAGNRARRRTCDRGGLPLSTCDETVPLGWVARLASSQGPQAQEISVRRSMEFNAGFFISVLPDVSCAAPPA